MKQRIVYFALIFSTFIYWLVLWMILRNRTPMGTIEQELHQPFILGVMLLSFAFFAVSFVLRIPIMRWLMAEGACIHSLYAAMIALDWRLFAIGWVLSIVGFALAYPSAREA